MKENKMAFMLNLRLSEKRLKKIHACKLIRQEFLQRKRVYMKHLFKNNTEQKRENISDDINQRKFIP